MDWDTAPSPSASLHTEDAAAWQQIPLTRTGAGGQEAGPSLTGHQCLVHVLIYFVLPIAANSISTGNRVRGAAEAVKEASGTAHTLLPVTSGLREVCGCEEFTSLGAPGSNGAKSRGSALTCREKTEDHQAALGCHSGMTGQRLEQRRLKTVNGVEQPLQTVSCTREQTGADSGFLCLRTSQELGE